MPDYFFRFEGVPLPSDEPVAFESNEAAREAAIETFGEMLRLDRGVLQSGHFRLDLLDAEGRDLVRLEATMSKSPET
jgi:hypothetical protein